MSVSIQASSQYISIGCKLALNAVGGVAPFTYSITSGEGSVDADGIFTAQATDYGKTVVRVTDSEASFSEITINIVSFLHLVAHIIKTELSLDSDQVYIFNQKLFVPKDDRLYISVALESSKPISTSSKFINGVEYKAVSNFNGLKIDIMSKSIEALIKKDAVVASLRSNFSQNVQTANSFKLANIPSNVNSVSGIDGTAIPFRFVAMLNAYNVTLIQQNVSYFDGNTIGFSSKTGDNLILDDSGA